MNVQLSIRVITHRDGAITVLRNIELPCPPFPSMILCAVRYSAPDTDEYEDRIEEVFWGHKKQVLTAYLENDDNRIADADGYWSKEKLLKEEYRDWTLAEDVSGDSLATDEPDSNER